ncbi:MAG: class I SAM-dependent methyltransferase [Acidobacteriota bacterium]|nr:class I SAM-dependent methyltransferase [Acidobacteriota bacterium]
MAEERYVEGAPAGADGWREVWLADRRYRPQPSRHEWLLRIVRRIFRRAAEPDTERQKNYNVALLDLVNDLRGDIAAARSDFRADLESVQRDLGVAVGMESEKLRELVLVAARRNDSLIAALDQKIESVAVRVRDAVNPVVHAQSSDVLYRRLEDALRGSEAHVREDVAHYAHLASSHQPVLDVGCGRGEFLALCHEREIKVRGVDTNERSVSDLRERGLDAALGAIPECFAPIADSSLGAVLAMHVVEHLPVDALFALFRESARVLRSGGLLMIETPNAESMAMSAGDFWRDPTHIAPRHPAALTVLAREHGFAIEEIRAIHDLPEGTRIPIHAEDSPELQRVIHALNDRLFAPQDLRLILRRT